MGGGGKAQNAIQELIARGRQRGTVTYEEINRTIPPEQVSYEEIEDLMARLAELDIAVVDSGETEGDP